MDSADCERNYHFRADHTGPNLGRAVDTGQFPFVTLQEIERLLGHVDLAESFGHDKRAADIFAAGDGDADIVAEEIAKVLVIESTHYNAIDARRRSLS